MSEAFRLNDIKFYRLILLLNFIFISTLVVRGLWVFGTVATLGSIFIQGAPITADEQCRDLDGIVADIDDEDVDFNFVKIHLLSHLGDHIRRFGNIQMYFTESGETNHKTVIKKGYRRSNKNDASHQILRTYARLDSFKIHKMNIQADLPRLIADELRDK